MIKRAVKNAKSMFSDNIQDNPIVVERLDEFVVHFVKKA